MKACAALLAAVPEELDPGVTRRPVTGDATRTAAWGEPPITLRCGVPLPDQGQTPLVINGLAFVTKETGDTVLYTTQARSVNVALEIPTAYENQGDVVIPLVEPILRTLPEPEAAPGA